MIRRYIWIRISWVLGQANSNARRGGDGVQGEEGGMHDTESTEVKEEEKERCMLGG